MNARTGMLTIVAVLASLLLVGGVAQGQSLSSKSVGDIDAVLQRAVQQGTVRGVVAIVVSKDRILYHHAYGLRDVKGQKPVQEDSIFRIASMTKPITSAAILQLKVYQDFEEAIGRNLH